MRKCLLVILKITIFLVFTAAGRAANPPATWTTGHKKVLIIPVRFTDDSGPSDAPNFTGTLSGWGSIVNGSMTVNVMRSTV